MKPSRCNSPSVDASKPAPVNPRQWSLRQIAEAIGLRLQGDGNRPIRGVATLANAEPDQIAFLANPRYRRDLETTRAAAVVLRADHAAISPVDALICDNPYAAFARIAALFEAAPGVAPGIHRTSIIADDAQIAASAHIGPLCCIGARSVVCDGAVVGPGCVIGEDCVIGSDSVLVARVTMVKNVRLGRRVRVHPGAVLGADGFGIAMDDDHWIKVPQLGGVVIGDDCEIGANTTIDRGALDDTILETDVRLDNQIQIGHNVRIGAHTAIAGCVAIAGSARIGKHCLIGGAAGIVGHIDITDRVTIAAMSLVTHSLHEAGEYASGTPLQASAQWRRNAVRFKHLDAVLRERQHQPTDQETDPDQ